MKHLFLTAFTFLGLFNAEAQVSIGTQSVPNVRAILDLTNGSNLGLLLPITLGDPSVSFPSDPEGMLLYHKDNLFLKGSSMWNPITPWKSKFVADAPVNVYFNPAGYTGVGIGIDGNVASNIKANLHVAFNSKEVSVANSNASIMIGDTDDGVAYMSFDNDEIAVKTGNVAPAFGTLKLQEGGGTVQVGESATIRSTLNVFGEVQQHDAALVPVGGIIMWTGTVAPPGWALCNGGTYTKLAGGSITAPDLRARFIVGAGSSYAIGDMDGLATVTLNSAQCATKPHQHGMDHGHLVTESSHTHGYTIRDAAGTGAQPGTSGAGGGSWTGATNSATTGLTVDDFSGYTDSNFLTPTANMTTLPHENRPPYYALAFIIKL